MVTDYLYVYTGFVQDRLDSLVTKYCYQYKIYGNRQLNVRDEVISDPSSTVASFFEAKNIVFWLKMNILWFLPQKRSATK